MMAIFDVADRYFIYDFFGFVQAKSVHDILLNSIAVRNAGWSPI